MEGHRSLPGLALIIVATGLFPFSTFLPQAIRTAWKERTTHSLLLFSLSMCTVVVLFFSFSRTILPSYPAPCVPFGAIVLGYFFSEWIASKEGKKGNRISAGIMLVLALLLPVAGYIALKQDAYLKDVSSYAFFLIICSVGAIVGTWFLSAGKRKEFFISYAITFALTGIALLYFVMPVLMGRNPVDQSMALVKARDRAVVCYRKTNPAYIFNLERTVPVVNTPEELQQFIGEHHNVTILTRADDSTDIQSLGLKTVYRGKDLFENPTTVVLEN
jgi:4-amino-4-deoxy-L-arabinose transferase-like glycosyltransferase